MNALAQNVTKLSKDYEALKKKCRQQQAEIEALKSRELTDDEIDELKNALEVCDYKYFGHYEFSKKQWDAFEVLEKHAKAILRKAQEK